MIFVKQPIPNDDVILARWFRCVADHESKSSTEDVLTTPAVYWDTVCSLQVKM